MESEEYSWNKGHGNPYFGHNHREEQMIRDWRGTSGSMSTDRSWEPAPYTNNELITQELAMDDSEGHEELARKKRELEIIEEQIARKKAAIAFKNRSVPIEGGTVSLKDRVHTIQKRWTQPTESHLKQCNLPPRGMQSFVEKRNISILFEDGQLAKDRLPVDSDNDLPLKRRVMSILKQHNPGVEVSSSRKQSSVEGSTSLRSLSESPDQQASSTGFLRFLSVLNKGVDVAMLSAIVNGVEQTTACAGQSHENGAPLQGHGRSNSRERKNGLLDPSGSSSLSPEEERKEREDKEHFGRFQALLETVGLELGEEEVSRLTDRTNERLYGKKHPRERRESERNGRDSDHRRHRSSSLSDCSGRISPHRQLHRWEASGGHRCSGERDEPSGKSMSPAGHQYCRDPVFPASQYSQVSTLPGSSSTHYSHYASHADYYSSLYNRAFSQGWSYAVTQATQHSLPVEPPSSQYSEQYSHFPNPSYNYGSSADGSAVLGVAQRDPAHVYARLGSTADCKVIETVGRRARVRCLQVLSEAKWSSTESEGTRKHAEARRKTFHEKKLNLRILTPLRKKRKHSNGERNPGEEKAGSSGGRQGLTQQKAGAEQQEVEADPDTRETSQIDA